MGLEAWVRPLGTVPDWPRGGAPVNASAAARREWIKRLRELLELQMAAHSGPIVFLEGAELGLGGAAPPAPVTTLSAMDPNAFTRAPEAPNGTSLACIRPDGGRSPARCCVRVR